MEKLKILYSKKQVDWAWRTLVNISSTPEEKEKALQILNNWRAVHDYPMNTFQSTIRSKVKSFRFKAIVVERLKRKYSILLKLNRNPKMKLSRMQDIWWLRVVLREIDYVYKLRNSIVNSKFAHVLLRNDDYIISPKKSGYRWIHLVYKYKNKYTPDYNWLQIEIQLRTELQHIRATAVEIMWIILKYSLKSSEWPEQRLNFFSVCSSVFALREKQNKLSEHENVSDSDLKMQLKQMIIKLGVIEKMMAYSSAIEFIDTKLSKKKKIYKDYLLVLDIRKKNILVHGFKKWELTEATDLYLSYEREFTSEKDGQVVLVSWEWLRQLKKAYPNYFWDSSEFIKILESYLR